MTIHDGRVAESNEIDAGAGADADAVDAGAAVRKSSIVAVSDDPFALREGKTLLWRNVNMTVVRPRRKTRDALKRG